MKHINDKNIFKVVFVFSVLFLSNLGTKSVSAYSMTNNLPNTGVRNYTIIAIVLLFAVLLLKKFTEKKDDKDKE